MSKKNEINYTIELNGVLDYMSTVLLNEFPTDVLTPEYLILAILDTRDSHANLILDNCLMSNNIDELRKVYVEVINSHINPQLKDGNVRFNDELIRILDCARIESEKLNNSQVGSEHVLLAILNKENNFKEENVFSRFMLQYEFIFNKCDVNTANQEKGTKTNKLKPKKITKTKPKNDIPLKSQVNTKTITTDLSSNSVIEQFTTSLNKMADNGQIDDIIGRRDEIEEIIQVLSRRKKNNAILVGKGGVGKCLAKGTKVLMYDGTFKNVEDILVGDKLMGIDSTPRNVLALGHGFDDMYKVYQKNGMSYTVNSEHILSLKGGHYNGLTMNKIYDIPIKEFMSFSKSKKENLLGYKSGLINFENRSELSIDPYFLGLWLGDGSSANVAITNIDEPIINFVNEYAEANDCRIKKEKITYHLSRKDRGTLIEINGNGIKEIATIKEISEKYGIARSSINDVLSEKQKQTHGFSINYVDDGKNPILEKFRGYNLINNKHIPLEYKTASKEDRLKLLAGIIDTDGHCMYGRGYEISQKNKTLFDDIVFLCNSLGLNTRIRKTKVIKGREYYRMGIYGNLLTELPVRLERKKITNLHPNKDSLKTQIEKIECIGRSEYFGFQIDGDKRFILEDFTVTHNTAIVYGIAKMIEENKVPNVLEDKEIVMLNPMALVSGTHFRGMFEERMKNLIDALQSSNRYILFIDDIHTVLKSGSKEKDGDISGMIGDLLSEGTVKVIATTTFKEYRNAIESNTQISRKFQKIVIESATIEESINVLKQNKRYYEDYHNVSYSNEAIEKAVKLADRYITDRSLPDSAFDLIDLAGAKTTLIDREPIEIQNTKKRMRQIEEDKNEALNNGDFEKIDSLTIEENVLASDLADYKRDINNLSLAKIDITESDIADVVSEVTKIPVSKLNTNEKSKIAHIDEVLKKSVIGQDEAVDAVCRVIKRNKVGLGDKAKTMANLLFVGPTGSGKCVSKDTKIRIRNKKTHKIQEITIEEFKNIASRTK